MQTVLVKITVLLLWYLSLFFRGGGWHDRQYRCTSTYRLPFPDWQKVYNVGFRVIIEDGPVASTKAKIRTRTVSAK